MTADEAADLHARADDALERGELDDAERFALAAIAAFAALDPAHPDHANALLLHARIAHARSHYAPALALSEQAHAITERALASYPDEPIVLRLHAHATCQLALALQGLGRHDDAEDMLLRWLPLFEQHLADQAELAHVHNLLGISHKYQARYDEAEARYAQALAILRASGAEVAIDLAGLEHNLGGLHHARGDLDQALAHGARALELRASVLGPDHVLVAADAAALGAILADLRRFDEAEQHLRRALAIFERAFGERHVEVALALGALGTLHVVQGHRDAARLLLERARALLVALLGEDHIEVARIDRVSMHGAGDAGPTPPAQRDQIRRG